MRSRTLKHASILAVSFVSLSLLGTSCPLGLKLQAFLDLHASNVDKYVGDFTPATSEPAGDWTKHTFDTAAGDGPICINGSPFTVFTRARNPFNLVIFLNGGGACWQGFYFCSLTASTTPPGQAGIFADSFDAGGGNIIENPFKDYSMMFVSYCDGSVFTGDNTLADASFPQGAGTRHHRGLRNLTAAMDLAKDQFPLATRVVLSGSSAGGFGVAAYAPFVFRFVFGNFPRLFVLNDSGPAVTNLSQTTVIATRNNDWQQNQFIPASCTEGTPDAQPVEIVEWMLENDTQVREALYSTDGDATIRFFLSIPTQTAYRDLLLSVHDPMNAAFPTRYKRFIKSGSSAHTMLGGALFYTSTIDGVPLYQWTKDFANQKAGWVDLVEDFIPLP